MSRAAGVSYTGSEIINVHKTKEQREHNKTLFPNPNQNNNGSFVLRHLSSVHESLPSRASSVKRASAANLSGLPHINRP